ncbi:MAG: segregation/condensation protein A [Bacteroidetes bacterium QS_8_68_15]|nr:MAG: segregation/condensation protein A [Bacteroidetes bacterium QS_8_68_15]
MYHVELEQFEGPLDLLLFFVRRDEVDVYDIPIARITDEFLDYVRLMEEIDLDGVGDFIYMAALLVRIKARMLLPQEEEGTEETEEDPRRELVERLMEYVRFKEASEQLSGRHARRADRFTRGHAAAVEEERYGERTEVEIDASVYDLIDALGGILIDEPEAEEPSFDVEPFEHTVEEQQAFVLREVRTGRRTAFRALVRDESDAFVIATFLAVLELARQRQVRLLLEEGAAASFFVEGRRSPEEPPPPQQEPETLTNGASNGHAGA